MAKVYTVGSNKGGVGKSTTVMNIAGFYANKGHKVAVIDTDVDYEENGLKNEGRKSCQKFFLGRQNAYESQVPYILCMAIPPNQKLNSHISNLKKDGYEYIIVDTPGFSNIAFQSAAISSDKVLILTEPGRVSYDSNLALALKLQSLEEQLQLTYEDFTINSLMMVSRFDAQKKPDLKSLRKFYALNLIKHFDFSINTLNNIKAITNAQNEFLTVFDDESYKNGRGIYSVLISELEGERAPRWKRGQDLDNTLLTLVNDEAIID